MKIISLASILLLVSTYAFGNDEDEKPIFHESDLRDWCKAESFSYFRSKNITPHNWTAKWWNKGNMLHVEGQWKIKGNKVKINCHLGKGGKTKYAEMEIKGESEL